MTKRRVPNLIVEYAEDQGNLFLLSVISYRKEEYLTVIDNVTDDEVTAYVLDFAQQEGIDLQLLLSVITRWFYSASHRYPLSFEFSRLGISSMTNRIHRTFETVHVSRLIGKDFRFNFDGPTKTKRRKANRIPAGVEIRLRKAADQAARTAT